MDLWMELYMCKIKVNHTAKTTECQRYFIQKNDSVCVKQRINSSMKSKERMPSHNYSRCPPLNETSMKNLVRNLKSIAPVIEIHHLFFILHVEKKFHLFSECQTNMGPMKWESTYSEQGDITVYLCNILVKPEPHEFRMKIGSHISRKRISKNYTNITNQNELFQDSLYIASVHNGTLWLNE